MAALILALAAGPIIGAAVLAADPVVTVRPGDTLTALSRRHDVPIPTLVELNAIANPNRIYVGQRLRLASDEAAPADPAPTPTAEQVHLIRPGEHLTGVARRYGVSISALAAANGISNPSRIYAGQRLVILGTAAPAATSPSPASDRAYVVSPGEHLTGVARRYGVSISALAAANGISNPSRIYAGQRLVIPGTAAPAATAPSPAMPSSMAALVAQRGAVRNVIVEEANRYGVPVPFALAVAWQESGWQQHVVSHAGAVGVMQLMPATAEWIGQAMLGTPVDSRDLRQNVRAGARLLAHYLDRYDGDRSLVLAAYYQGQSAADRHGIYPVSRPYIASITALERLFGD